MTVLVLIVAAGGAAWYGTHADSHRSGSHITIDRQVWVSGLDGRVTAMANIPNGGFVIAGYQKTGWAVATDAQGNLLWKYIAPFDENLGLGTPASTHSEFYGVVPLPNGNVLLCGQKTTEKLDTVGLITILSNTGLLLEERQVLANKDRDYSVPTFGGKIYGCSRWDDGVALIGGKLDNSEKPPAWAIKLDGSAEKKWEKLLVAGSQWTRPILVIDRDLVLAHVEVKPTTTEFTIEKWNETGEAVAKSAPITGKYPYLFRSFQSEHEIGLMAYFDVSNTYQLHVLGERLEQVGRPKQVRVNNFDLQEGFGYRLPDHSLLLFGRSATQSGDRGSIERIGKDGEYLDLLVFPQIL
ncbi:MAG TPA: hypothetical protein VHW95_06115, partial [Steroidobacteraceae bacterium]|nr:hypothetical protein [Steroidobacteraceae bacterium]